MITKSAVAAWKQMMPYLGDAAQQRLMKFRKPLVEYNASMSRANEAIADKLGINITARNNSSVNPLTDRALGNLLNRPDLKEYNPISGNFTMRAPVEELRGLGNAFIKETDLPARMKRNVQRELDKLPVNQPHYNRIVVADSFGNAKGDYLRNLIMRHELEEGKNMLKYYTLSKDGTMYIPKNGVQLTRPTNDAYNSFIPNTMGHASLDVLKDEFKHALKSGYADRYLTKDPHLDLGMLRYRDGEISDIVRTRAKASKKRDHLNNVFEPNMEELKAGKEYFTRGDVKKMQSQFFTDMRRQQSRNNVRSNEPVSVKDVPTWNLHHADITKRRAKHKKRQPQ